jgi:hypothetical protein
VVLKKGVCSVLTADEGANLMVSASSGVPGALPWVPAVRPTCEHHSIKSLAKAALNVVNYDRSADLSKDIDLLVYGGITTGY